MYICLNMPNITFGRNECGGMRQHRLNRVK